MRKVLLALPIFLLFLAPVFADTDLNSVCGGGSYTITSSDTTYSLSGDLSCNVNFGLGNVYRNITIDLRGFALTGTIVNDRNSITGWEIKDGIIVGTIYSRNANSGVLSKPFFHNLNIQQIGASPAIRIAYASGAPSQIDEILMENMTISSAGDIMATSGTLTVKNSAFTCTGGNAINTGDIYLTNQVVGVQTYENVMQTGCSMPSYQLSTFNLNAGTVVILRNSSSIDVEAIETSGFSNTIIYEEPLIITMKDQNSALISGVGVVRKTSGSRSPVSSNWNPTESADVGINNGIATAFFAKNITSYGGFSSYPTYNLTVKSRGQSQSRLITFNSPSDQNFTLDFSSEDTGSNVIIDNRTVAEKSGNAITGVIAFLSPIAMFFAPFLLLVI